LESFEREDLKREVSPTVLLREALLRLTLALRESMRPKMRALLPVVFLVTGAA
jgi:hypothetical protein